MESFGSVKLQRHCVLSVIVNVTEHWTMDGSTHENGIYIYLRTEIIVGPNWPEAKTTTFLHWVWAPCVGSARAEATLISSDVFSKTSWGWGFQAQTIEREILHRKHLGGSQTGFVGRKHTTVAWSRSEGDEIAVGWGGNCTMNNLC